MSHPYSEDALVEQPALELLQEVLGWEWINGYGEKDGPLPQFTGRETLGQVILPGRLQAALERLNPDASQDSIRQAIEEMSTDRSVLEPVRANREVYQLLKDGVKVTVEDGDGNQTVETVRVIDWNNPDNNDFLAINQLWIAGDLGRKRPDVVGFVNGLPLLVMELKASHKNLRSGYDINIRDYRSTIPQLFWFNAAILISNGSETKVGSMSARWEHYTDWKKISSEEEE